ncbi:glycosyltransferase family 2 protein [uncultured Spirosoma sp.]|uniref:glycosyltransferase family 2 protein n=1 Tax=uncultured Spirosoma sp. TaxID=278208 RepID=UPI00258DE4D3|nr:glycosyltransferase family 2 protein [uncultured Spirosoma sp.]
MTLPTITVITPSYNQGDFIRQTIESVLSQGYPHLDYIVMDGASTDNTLSVLKAYESQLTLISEPDRGQTDAINKGLRRATGEIVCWLNSDDYFLPGALLRVGTYFATHPDSDWLTADCLIVDAVGTPIQQPIRYYKLLLRSLPNQAYLGLTNAVCQPATFWRRAVHERVGYLNENLHFTMDYDFWLRLAQQSPPAVLREPTSAFRIHGQSKGGQQYIEQFLEDEQTMQLYTRSALTRWLHRRHNRLIVGLYKLLK